MYLLVYVYDTSSRVKSFGKLSNITTFFVQHISVESLFKQVFLCNSDCRAVDTHLAARDRIIKRLTSFSEPA